MASINAADANLNQLSTESSFEGSYVCEFNSKANKWKCQQQYKTEILQAIIDQHDNKDGRQSIDQLKEFGVTVYLAEYETLDIKLLKQVILHATVNKNDRSKDPQENQRCLLYRDKNGQLFNLTIDNGAIGLANTFKNLKLTASGLQAMLAMTVLTRPYGCMDHDAQVKPGYFLGLMLGLVLSEEMSHSVLNVAMLVQGLPSVAAFSLVSGFVTDWPKNIAVSFLALATVQEIGSFSQKICTLMGISLSMALLAANLGSRAWLHMRWAPLGKAFGPFTSFYAFCAAVGTGLVFPYMGFRDILSGGKSATRTIIINCLIVSIFFVLSDLNAVKEFFFVGEACDQSITNVALGSWLAMTSVISMFAARKISPSESYLMNEGEIDQILDEDQASPVGFTVPNFPNFCLDRVNFKDEGFSCVSANMQIFFGVVICLGLGVFVGATSYFDYF